MGLVVKQPNELTPNYNDLQALFHYNKVDCQIYPATKIMDYSAC